jgi:flagellar basal-body rod protein FlgG
MFRSLDIAATGMAAQETKLDTIASNLANANTVGFKRQDATFEDLLYQTVTAPGGSAPAGVQLGTGARVVSTPRSFTQGSVQQTGKPLDLAIEGSGFFAVQRTSGEVAYTRAGTLQLDATGRLVTSDGLPVEPPITVPPDASSVTIASDGTVTAQRAGQTAPVALGQLHLASFANPTGLEAIGHNLYVPTSSSGDATTGTPGTEGRGTILQGATEGSNVEVVTEMIGMIRAQRSYEINSKVISAADEMLRNATQLGH